MGPRVREGMDRHVKYIFPYHPLHLLSLSCEGVALMNARGSSLLFVLVFITFVGHINPLLPLRLPLSDTNKCNTKAR